ncbi:MAG TPA: hypothetical protein ENL22_07830 [candidate division Zixibacteria bacterium]|nr:hypothetical protein [candidate division Zixibacteria bacterium]
MTRSEKWRKLFDELGLIDGKDIVIPDDIHELIFGMRDGSCHSIRSIDENRNETEWHREIKGDFFISWRKHRGDESWVDDKHTASFRGNPWVAEKYILMDDITDIHISRRLDKNMYEDAPTPVSARY